MLNSIISVDLHIHSKASAYKDGEVVADSDKGHLNVLFDNLIDKEIDLFSFSDHNRFDAQLYCDAKNLISSTDKYHNLKMVSSVEFDVQIDDGKPSCHIIAVFDSKTDSDMNKIANGISKYYLAKKDDFYTREKFEMLLKDIGLSVLLIACQRKSIENKNGGKNCLSDSCDNPLEFIKSGYINALEYQSPNVEGILNNCLVDIPKDLGISLVAGSDCHEWCAYPYHDSKCPKTNKSFSFKIKSLPTFMGLVLAFSAPSSRFKRRISANSSVKNFSLNGKDYELSNGINAIIGENGSGKSTLLTGLSNGSTNKEPYMKALLKNNGFVLDAVSSVEIKHITQSLLINNVYKKNSVFGDEIEFKKINNDEFEKSYKNFGESIYDKISSNIALKTKIDALSKINISINLELENKETFFININKSENFTKIENNYESHLVAINKILNELKQEYSSSIYSSSAKSEIKEAFIHLTNVKNDLTNKYLQIVYETKIKNIMSSLIDDYISDLKKKSNTIDTEKTEYDANKNKFIDSIVSAIQEKQKSLSLIVKEPKLSNNEGYSVVSNNGFDFISSTKYYNNDSLLELFYKSAFNANYQTLDKIILIDTVSEASKCVKGTGLSQEYKSKLSSNVEAFIKELEEESYTVLETTSKQKMGNTLGEKAIVFYRYITRKCSDKYVYLIDQPEDNISNPKIISELIKYISELRDKTQVIFVTHNPLLVINLDVDNLIYLHNNNGKIDAISGCLEDDGILNVVAENMDGGKEALRRRLKVYGN